MTNQPILVKDWMSVPVRTVSPDTPVGDAYGLMMNRGIRRLPVVSQHAGQVVGIVTIGDLREARPSTSATLSIYELNYLLAKLRVGQVMTHDPYTVTPDTPIQKAARIMLERKVSGLPVVNEQGGEGGEGGEGRVVGIITESDIFRMLIDQWGYFTQQHADLGLVASLIAQETQK